MHTPDPLVFVHVSLALHTMSPHPHWAGLTADPDVLGHSGMQVPAPLLSTEQLLFPTQVVSPHPHVGLIAFPVVLGHVGLHTPEPPV